MNLGEFKNSWALVTGASSGIGKEYCLQLARRGIHIAMLARDESRLNELSQNISEQYSVDTLVLAVDLSDQEAVNASLKKIYNKGIRIRMIINNAGIGKWGRFEAAPSQLYNDMLQINLAAPIHVCRELLPSLLSFSSSIIINVSSQASLQPVPYMAVYAALKSALSHFSLALSEEFKDRGLYVQTFLPAPTQTEFDRKAGAYESALGTKRFLVTQTVNTSLSHISKKTLLVSNAKGIFWQRFWMGVLSFDFLLRQVAKMFQPQDGAALQRNEKP